MAPFSRYGPEQRGTRKAVLLALTLATLLLAAPGCICLVMCFRINGTNVLGNCSTENCQSGGSGSAYVWQDPCSSPSWTDSDNDSISDATELNPSNAYLRLNKDRFDPNPTLAKGVPVDGSLAYGMNITNTSGRACNGYYRYQICDIDSLGHNVCEPMDRGDWGTARLLWTIERIALAWRYLHGGPRMGVGHLSLQNGGRFVSYFNSVNNAHIEHRNGLQVDIRYLRQSGTESGLDLNNAAHVADFDTVRTAELVNLFVQSRFVREIIIDDRTGILAGTVGNVTIRNDRTVHHNHFHVSVWDPDGLLN